MGLTVIVEEEINAEVGEVFRQMTDLNSWSRLVSGIRAVEALTDGPFRVGTRWKETRVMFGKEATEEMEVTRLQQNEAMTIEANSCGALYQTEIDYRETASGTIVRMSTVVKPLTLMAKLTSPLGWMMSGMLKKCLAKDLADIKRAVESSEPQFA